MSYIDQGFNQYLSREDTPTSQIKELDPLQVDQLISQLDGGKITNYASDTFNFVPSVPSPNPKEGDLYYDKTNKKLKIYTGVGYEIINSV